MLVTRFVALTLAVLCAMASAAEAGRLLAPAGRTRAATVRGVTALQPLRLDHAALASLRAQRTAVLDDFPLGRARTATLELRRFEPFAGTRAVVMEPGGAREIALPDRTYFTGSVRGEPTSRVLLIAGTDAVQGFVSSGGDVYPFGPDANGRHRTYAMSSVDPTQNPPPGDFCKNDLMRDKVEGPRTLAQLGAAPPPLTPRAGGAMLRVQIAVDTDQELRAKFGSNQATLDYLTALLAAGNVIYERDTSVRLDFSFIRLWDTPDPWSYPGSDVVGVSLDELQAYWTNPGNDMDAVAGPRDVVHMISGKDVDGGVAYLSAVCIPDYGFGVSQVFGSFDTADPQDTWDVIVFTHELGHNLGSEHTHCYSPPIDRCFNQEGGCYSGPVVVSQGTLMSYCHLNPPGLSNVSLLFGDRVSTQIRSTVEGASCLDVVPTNCGNGTIDAGEQCDDGNTTPGDHCSATCQIESVCGDGVTEGNELCDDSNTAAGDGCAPVCRPEVCGSGYTDPGETCDDGNATDGDGCSSTCQREPRCGDGVLDAGESCDDGNTVTGDGCSAGCAPEPCTVLAPHQALWAPARLVIVRGANGDRLLLRGSFGIAADSPISVAEEGMRLLIQNAAGQLKLDATLSGDGWSDQGAKLKYRAFGAAAGGIRNVSLRQNPGPSINEIVVKITGKGDYGIEPSDLPLVVTLLLGDDTAGEAGACGRYDFAAGRCQASKSGRKINCR